MKTEEQIREKLKELDKMMYDAIPNENDIQEIRDFRNGELNLQTPELLLKILSRSTHTFSIDAQRYIIEWILEQHD